ncbi:hypothetical protein B7494_g6003 [Chlorociboria aeruginascens]|nr:hypothetical protein B7494_g6003 [Chlorociboria aeruginascens]
MLFFYMAAYENPASSLANLTKSHAAVSLNMLDPTQQELDELIDWSQGDLPDACYRFVQPAADMDLSGCDLNLTPAGFTDLSSSNPVGFPKSQGPPDYSKQRRHNLPL